MYDQPKFDGDRLNEGAAHQRHRFLQLQIQRLHRAGGSRLNQATHFVISEPRADGQHIPISQQEAQALRYLISLDLSQLGDLHKQRDHRMRTAMWQAGEIGCICPAAADPSAAICLRQSSPHH